MKKALFLILALCVLGLSACSASPAATDVPAATAATSTQPEATAAPAADESPAAQTLRVEPMASWLDLSNLTDLTDCTVQVSFDLKQDLVSADGGYQLTMAVYDYDRYDAVDVSQLKEGDVIVIDGQDVVVSSIDRSNGVAINGGLDEGGYELGADEGGAFRIWSVDDAIDYRPIGSVTSPISPDFKMTDSSDLEKGETTASLADFTALEGDAAVFGCGNTQARIANGELVSVQRFYMP